MPTDGPAAVPPGAWFVLPDTNVWVAARKKDPTTVRILARLSDDGAVGFLPPVWFEFRRGLRGVPAAVDHQLAPFRRLPLVPLGRPGEDGAREVWDAAAGFARRLDSAPAAGPAAGRRHRVQMTDCLLAAASAVGGHSVWSRDPDLAALAAADPRVRLYSP